MNESPQGDKTCQSDKMYNSASQVKRKHIFHNFFLGKGGRVGLTFPFPDCVSRHTASFSVLKCKEHKCNAPMLEAKSLLFGGQIRKSPSNVILCENSHVAIQNHKKKKKKSKTGMNLITLNFRLLRRLPLCSLCRVPQWPEYREGEKEQTHCSFRLHRKDCSLCSFCKRRRERANTLQFQTT